MKIERKPNSQLRAEKEKVVMENCASVMKKLDTTFLIESTDSEKSEEDSDESKEK